MPRSGQPPELPSSFLEIGGTLGGPVSLEKSLRVANGMLAANGLADAIHLEEGSGISRDNHFTARGLAQLLHLSISKTKSDSIDGEVRPGRCWLNRSAMWGIFLQAEMGPCRVVTRSIFLQDTPKMGLAPHDVFQPCAGGLRPRSMHFETVDCATVKPSLSSSP